MRLIETDVFQLPQLHKHFSVSGNNFGHIMADTTIQDKLLRLGYSQYWLDSGVLTIDSLEEQIIELDFGEDNNTEHYRCRTLTNYFNTQTSFDSIVLKQVLQILQNDSDKLMAGSAMVDLLRKSSLTDEQFDTVTGVLRTFGDWTINPIDREQRKRLKS